LPQGRDQRGDVLQLAEAVCGPVTHGKLKRIVADLSLDKAMLQDVLSKKL
jgi:hypothetical protein